MKKSHTFLAHQLEGSMSDTNLANVRNRINSVECFNKEEDVSSMYFPPDHHFRQDTSNEPSVAQPVEQDA